MNDRLLVIAIDAANPDLVERWTESGDLPMLAQLHAEGVSGRVQGLQGFFVGSTWPSLYTALSPAGHGHHSLVQLRRGSYALYRCADEQLVAGVPFWQRLSDAGKRVAVLDVPLSQSAEHLHGVQTVEWGSHDSLYGFDARPQGLRRRIRRDHGLHPLGPSCDGVRQTVDDYRDLVDRLLRGVRAKRDLTRSLLRRESWNFAIQVFTEAHCAGHQCWHLHDPSHPAHDPYIAATIGDPLRRVYREIDDAIGVILADHPDVPLIVFSAHGMSYWYGAQFLLKDVLTRLGVARAWPAPAASAEPQFGIAGLVRWAWRRLPETTRARVRHRMESFQREQLPSLPVDAARSLCFPVNNGLAVGGIRLNLRGREPQGRLAQGEQAEAFCRRLESDLLEIRDERTGKQAIRRVTRTCDLYRGPQIDALPDLLVEWSDEVATGSVMVGRGAAATVLLSSPKIGTLEGTNRYGRTGEHRPEGFFVARLPHVRPTRLSRPVSLLDLAPTFCALVGVNLTGVEGSVISVLASTRGNDAP